MFAISSEEGEEFETKIQTCKLTMSLGKRNERGAAKRQAEKDKTHREFK